MKLSIVGGLPLVRADVSYRGQAVSLDHVLVDTGSGGTVFAADQLFEVGVLPDPDDPLRRIAGVGGAEYVFEKMLDTLEVGALAVDDFRIEVGALDYGFAINGILGCDFLMAVGANINLRALTVTPAR